MVNRVQNLPVPKSTGRFVLSEDMCFVRIL